jgi:DNA-binding response OmpR family regulator
LRAPLQAEAPVEAPIALVAATREYRTLDILPNLVRSGFTALERGRPECLFLARELQPVLIVAAIDPLRSEDLDLLRELSACPVDFLLVVAPSPDGFAAALNAGADACLCDDDGPTALTAQFVSVRRRHLLTAGAAAPLRTQFGDISVDYQGCRVRVGDRPLALTPMEYALFAYLARHAGTVCRPVQILESVEGVTYDEQPAAQKLKVHMWRIRGKLKQLGVSDEVVSNIRGVGYLFDHGD